MKTVNIHDAKTNLSKLLEQVQRGEEVIISKAGHPIAELIAYTPPTNAIKFGLAKGQIEYYGDIVNPDPDIIAMFDANTILPDNNE